MFTTIEKSETAVIPEAKVYETTPTSAPVAALWRCDACQTWWGSQDGRQPEARFLLKLAEPHTALFKWEDYRGWREKADGAHICADCGHEAALPHFSLFSQANGRGV
jgi:hypothetical protein